MIGSSVIPVFALILLGAVLKRFGMTDDPFLKTSDRLVYFIFFPAMLFWKIGGAKGAAIPWPFVSACLTAVAVLYGASTWYIVRFRVPAFQAGTFSQSCYRFNTYVGMAIILTALGEEGVRCFGIMIGFIIPIINVLAVSTLIWFSGGRVAGNERVRLTAKALISNPLILACVAGLVFSRSGLPLPGFLDNTLRLLSLVTLPLALISIGGSLSAGTLFEHLRLSLVGSAFKLVLLPVTGWICLALFNVTGMPRTVGMIFFALPASSAIYVLSSQLHSDTNLASATITLSTLLSVVSLSIILSLF